MAFDQGVKGRFMLGAAIEFVGIIALAVALAADVGGATVVVLGGVAIAIGAALQVSAILMARRSAARKDS